MDRPVGQVRLTGRSAQGVTLFRLEGVAVYLEQPVLERVLVEFRAVTVAGSPLAISVSTENAQSAERERFRAAVAAVGEPVRSTLSPAAARELLAGAGWQVPEEGRDRLRFAGLLLARAAASSPHPERARPPHRPSAKWRQRRSDPEIRAPPGCPCAAAHCSRPSRVRPHDADCRASRR